LARSSIENVSHRIALALRIPSRFAGRTVSSTASSRPRVSGEGSLAVDALVRAVQSDATRSFAQPVPSSANASSIGVVERSFRPDSNPVQVDQEGAALGGDSARRVLPRCLRGGEQQLCDEVTVRTVIRRVVAGLLLSSGAAFGRGSGCKRVDLAEEVEVVRQDPAQKTGF
jgi:hypothetical protein